MGLINIDISAAQVIDTQSGAMLDDLKNAIQTVSDTDIDAIALNSEIQNSRHIALLILLVFAQDIIDEELEEGETLTDHLDLLIDAATGEIDDDSENYAYSVLVANMQDAALSLGAPIDVVEGAFIGDDPEVQDSYLESLADFINANVPDDEQLKEFCEDFVYGSPNTFDDEDLPEQLDALSVGKLSVKKRNGQNVSYRAVKAVRNGVVKLVNKRTNPGRKMKLSAKQRAAIKRMQVKSQRGAAMKKRLKSAAKGRKLGLYK